MLALIKLAVTNKAEQIMINLGKLKTPPDIQRGAHTQVILSYHLGGQPYNSPEVIAKAQ